MIHKMIVSNNETKNHNLPVSKSYLTHIKRVYIRNHAISELHGCFFFAFMKMFNTVWI